MGGNRPDRHAASIKASSIPPQAAEPCPIHDLRAVTAGRASACAKTLSSNTASLRSLRGVPVPCAETQSTAWGSRPASASAPRTACSAKRADSSGAVSAPPSREAPNPRSSANTAAPRARADSKDSSTNAAPPSPGTKPSRASSKGRDASDGTGFRLSAWALAYPSIPPRERRESPPEQRTVSERPYRTRRKPSPMACSADAHAVPSTRPSPWISRKRANAVFPVLGSQRKSHRASSASESAEGSPFSRSKSSMGPDAPIRQVCGGMCESNPAEAAARRPDKTANAAPRFR